MVSRVEGPRNSWESEAKRQKRRGQSDMAGMELRRVVYPRLLLLAVWCLIAASCSSATTDVVSDEDSVPEEVLTDPVDGSDEQDADDPDVDDEDEVVEDEVVGDDDDEDEVVCLLYTSPSPRDRTRSRMPSSA